MPALLGLVGAHRLAGAKLLTRWLEHWEAILRINLTGMFLTAKPVLPQMVEAGGGSLISTSSSGAAEESIWVTAQFINVSGTGH